jgi:23S rRNA (adenine2030-N6)-methyltransferase
MLSYRHVFHAGNHADVLKHLSLIALLRALGKKPKPLCYFETHAGAGSYALNSDRAQKTQEFAQGAGRLLQHSARDPLLADYLQLIDSARAPGDAANYPGSPALAQTLLRPQDELQLCELHAAEVVLLNRMTHRDQRVHVHHRDGFAAINALLPPAQSRGLVLIDPPYETKTDYAACVEAIKTLRTRFRSACIALWYPRLPRSPALPMLKNLLTLPGTDKLHVVLDVGEALGDYGMYGSGMLILQPPWQLDQTLGNALKEATPLLAPYARFQIDYLTAPVQRSDT